MVEILNTAKVSLQFHLVSEPTGREKEIKFSDSIQSKLVINNNKKKKFQETNTPLLFLQHHMWCKRGATESTVKSVAFTLHMQFSSFLTILVVLNVSRKIIFNRKRLTTVSPRGMK